MRLFNGLLHFNRLCLFNRHLCNGSRFFRDGFSNLFWNSNRLVCDVRRFFNIFNGLIDTFHVRRLGFVVEDNCLEVDKGTIDAVAQRLVGSKGYLSVTVDSETLARAYVDTFAASYRYDLKCAQALYLD